MSDTRLPFAAGDLVKVNDTCWWSAEDIGKVGVIESCWFEDDEMWSECSVKFTEDNGTETFVVMDTSDVDLFVEPQPSSVSAFNRRVLFELIVAEIEGEPITNNDFGTWVSFLVAV